MYFTFIQNNSSGQYVINEQLDKGVIIEADNYEEAIQKALAIGIYFDDDPDESPRDCECCGPRWNRHPDPDTDVKINEWLSYKIHRSSGTIEHIAEKRESGGRSLPASVFQLLSMGAQDIYLSG